jgi:uncharacterized LabA/DUF88 family protein
VPTYERVIAYVDGHNLYHGLKTKKWHRYLWLDLGRFSESLLLAHQGLITAKFFTARVPSPLASVNRQKTYLDALDVQGRVLRYEGNFQAKPVECRRCHHAYTDYEEKQTDVNIAVEMVRDAHLDEMDMALLISGDSDLVPPVKAVIAEGKRVIVACPPARYSDALTRAASGSIPIYRKHLHHNQLPDEVVTESGYVLQRPTKWQRRLD